MAPLLRGALQTYQKSYTLQHSFSSSSSSTHLHNNAKCQLPRRCHSDGTWQRCLCGSCRSQSRDSGHCTAGAVLPDRRAVRSRMCSYDALRSVDGRGLRLLCRRNCSTFRTLELCELHCVIPLNLTFRKNWNRTSQINVAVVTIVTVCCFWCFFIRRKRHRQWWLRCVVELKYGNS